MKIKVYVYQSFSKIMLKLYKQ